jgi:hypothetical protein
MTSDRDIDRVLDRWFTESPANVADRVLDEVADRISRERQRPATRLPRRTIMTKPVSIAALAAAIVIAVVGWGLLGRQPSVGGPAATATASASPSVASPAIACEDDLPGCVGPLGTGIQRSTNLVPPLKYEIPDGSWSNVIDLPDLYKVDSTGGRVPGDPYLIVWTNASIATQTTASCAEPDGSRGRAAADWIDYVTTHPGIVATDRSDASISGRAATQFELSVARAWTQTCPGHTGPYVTLLTQRVGDQLAEYGVPTDGRALFTVYDVNRYTVVILSYGPTDEAAFDQTMAPIRRLIDSFVMCGPSVGWGPCGGLGAQSPAAPPSAAP